MLFALYILTTWLLVLHQSGPGIRGNVAVSFYATTQPIMRDQAVRTEQQTIGMSGFHHIMESVQLQRPQESPIAIKVATPFTWAQQKLVASASPSNAKSLGGAGGGFSGSNNNFFMSDADCYESLLDRFNKWHQRYQQMKLRTNGRSLKDAVEVVREQFGLVGPALVSAECPPDRQVSSGAWQPTDWISKVDYVYKALKKLVDQLETITDVVFEGKLEDSLPKLDGAYAVRLLERTKQRVVKMAEKQVHDAAKLSAINYLASTGFGMESQFSPVLESLVPVVEQLGNVDNRLMVDYLLNLDFRRALANLNSFNPMAFLLCREQRDDDDRC